MSTRRSFLVHSATAIGAAGVALPVLSACAGRAGAVLQPDADGVAELDVRQHASLQALGGSLRVTIGDDPVLVVHARDEAGAQDGGYLALSSKCTHMGCKVDYDAPSHEIRCPCHGSKFGEDGEVRNGPAKTPLRQFTVEAVTRDAAVVLRIRA